MTDLEFLATLEFRAMIRKDHGLIELSREDTARLFGHNIVMGMEYSFTKEALLRYIETARYRIVRQVTQALAASSAM